MLARKFTKKQILVLAIALLLKITLIISKSPPLEIQEVIIAKAIFNVHPTTYRLFNLIVYFFSSILFAFITSSVIKPSNKNKEKLFFVSFLVFFLSPWGNYISTFLPIQNIILFTLLLFIYLFPKKTFLSLAIIASISILYLGKTNKDFLYIKTYSPSKLAFEINQRQKIDFLSVNKKYILPAIFRKFTYNKPFLAISKLTSHSISFIDFELFASPLQSYEIIKLSGLSPKGNLPLLYLWEIPLILFGLYFLLNKRPKYFSKFLIVMFISFLPFMFFEKKILSKTGYLLLPSFVFIETVAIQQILLRVKIRYKKIILSTFSILIVFGIIDYHKMFFLKPTTYQTSHPMFYKEIAKWISKNPGKLSSNFVVTTKFGPSEIMIPYYLGQNSPPNIEYRSFDMRTEELKSNTYYFGLAGEFVGKGKYLEERELVQNINIVEKITGEEEPVFEYGKNIWIGYNKN